ncbi:MAG: hypothetical protein ACI8RD_002428 [Bacillariaceae sp.]|jgi:hypothetical protein
MMMLRQRLFIVFIVLSTVVTAMVAKGSNKKQQSLASGWKSSSATVSIQDHQRVQEILKNRHARKKPQLQEGGTIITETCIDDDEITEQPIEGRRSLSTIVPPKGETIRVGSRYNDTDTSSVMSSYYSNGTNFPYEFTIQALRAFYNEHSHLVLPRRYPVPKNSCYPTIWHGVDLAGTVYNMRWWQQHVKEQPDRVSELNKMGFVWERLQPEWNLILESLIVYKALNGNVLVPSNFTIPHDDNRWPKACWGISLGNSVYKIRNRGDHLSGNNPNAFSRRNQLDAIGFVWDVQELRFTKFCIALQLFGRIEQHRETIAVKVPSQYIVPRSSRWPNDMWGYRLGERCTQIRQKELYIKGHPHRLKILADYGFYVTGGSNNNLRWLEVVHAAAVYSQMNSNSLDVPTKFVVPAPPRRVASLVVGSDDAWPWPGKFVMCHTVIECAWSS